MVHWLRRTGRHMTSLPKDTLALLKRLGVADSAYADAGLSARSPITGEAIVDAVNVKGVPTVRTWVHAGQVDLVIEGESYRARQKPRLPRRT